MYQQFIKPLYLTDRHTLGHMVFAVHQYLADPTILGGLSATLP